VLCRSSALYLTLDGDPMYAAHQEGPPYESSDWAILSPDVPVFRRDDGTPLPAPWTTSFITSAAPYAHNFDVVRTPGAEPGLMRVDRGKPPQTDP
jgi:uncharacterized protein (TIGR02452 family)